MHSFMGAIAIADLVKTTLGPKGMDKILQSVRAAAPGRARAGPGQPPPPSPSSLTPPPLPPPATPPPPPPLGVQPQWRHCCDQ